MPVDHYENFPVASWLLPRHLRAPVAAVYWFARTADDIADEGDATPGQRLAALASLRGGLHRMAEGAPPEGPPFAALAPVAARHRLPAGLFHLLLDAFEQDVSVHRYTTFAALLDYCRRSADPVGRLMLHLYGFADASHLERSDAVCTGLQLANFWQDVAVDWTKGRLYIPQEDLDRHGVAESDIADGRTSARWSALMRFQTARTRTLLEQGWPLARTLPGRIGWELRLVIAGGLRILDRIDAVDGDVFRHRPVLRRTDWWPMLRVAWRGGDP